MATKKTVRKIKLGPQAKFASLKDELNDAFIARQSEIQAVLVAWLSRSHCLLLGPPGTAKSALVKAISEVMQGRYFRTLLTRFSLPEQINGPVDVAGIKKGKHERLTAGYLPEAEFAFLDEVFKGNAAILNSLLTLLNEREYQQGAQTLSSPLQVAVGASNELPESKELDALYDRFLIRVWTKYISDREERMALLKLQSSPLQTVLSKADVEAAQAAVERVDISEDMLELVLDIWEATEKAGFISSDRRWKSLLAVLKAKAYLEGRHEVEEEDLLILADILWNEPKDRPELLRVITKASNPALHTAQEILDAAKETYSQIPLNKDIPAHETAGMFETIVQANTQFKASVEKLGKLTNGSGNEAVERVIEEIEEMSQEASRFAARISGLNL